MFKKLTGSIALIIFALFLLTSVASAKTVNIKFVSSFPKKLPTLGAAYDYFLDTVEELSNGEIKIKFYDPGKLVPPLATLDTVSKGMAQMGMGTPNYWAGKMPAANIFHSVPFGPSATEKLAWLIKGNGMKMWQELYESSGYNVKVMPFMLVPHESMGWFAKPLPEDMNLSGLKMRVGGLAAKVFDKMGASVTFMAMGDVFTALERGALDACEFSYPSLDASLGFSKVVKYNYFPGWHSPPVTTDFFVNKDFWEKKLTAQQRKIIETAIYATILYSQSIGEIDQAITVKNNAETMGVKNMVLTEKQLDKFRQAWAEVVKEEMANDKMFNKIYTDFTAFRAQYKIWKDLAYVEE